MYIEKLYISDTRPLEVIFVDVGQGDGAVLITPEQGKAERIIVIDSGEGNHMERFLNGRFKAYRGFNFEAAVITHPDMDHYRGFQNIFENQKIGFKTIYHNGLAERPVSGTFAKLGGKHTDPSTGKQYLSDLAIGNQEMEQLFYDPVQNGRFTYPKMIHAALQNPKINEFRMLSTHPSQSTQENNRCYMPGFAPSNNKPYSIEVLGPIGKEESNGMLRLDLISSNYGEVKNGHSVILRLHYGKFKVLFGGDLNIPAEKYLLSCYAGLEEFPSKGSQEYITMMDAAKDWFEAEVMKVCHHGSDKVTDEFMKAVNPACFVISSGDSEGHVHPRPDLLGRLGKFGRGSSPVLLSTELQRSSREFEDKNLVNNLVRKINNLNSIPSADIKNALIESVKELAKTNVDVYGAIYLETDGERLITAFKIEEPSDLKKWFYFEYRLDDDGNLKLIS